jgi:hypothetical protein
VRASAVLRRRTSPALPTCRLHLVSQAPLGAEQDLGCDKGYGV